MRSVTLLAAARIKMADVCSIERETQLIDLWPAHPCLFECSSKCYSIRNTKVKVLVLYSVCVAVAHIYMSYQQTDIYSMMVYMVYFIYLVALSLDY